jgi:hypothetical protein
VGGANCTPVAGGEQHRQAIGDHDRACEAALRRDARVGALDGCVVRGVAGLESDDARAVHLLEEDRRRRERRREAAAVLGNGESPRRHAPVATSG